MAYKPNQAFDPRLCEHANARLTFRPDINGNPRYQRQCQDCGSPVGSFIARERALKLKIMTDIPVFDTGLLERMDALIVHLAEQSWADRREWYQKYLQTPAWRAKADLVHKRAGFICEGCRSARSVQVHHLTYNHIGNEFLWELVAICHACHERRHTDAGDHGYDTNITAKRAV